MKCLPAIPSDYEGAEVVCGIVTGSRAVIAAGRSFFEQYETITEEATSSEECSGDSSSSEGGETGEESHHHHRSHDASGRRKKKEQFSGNAVRLSNLLKDKNLYAILGVSENCSDDDVKKAYRKMVLENHPDKVGHLEESEREKKRTDFLRIQESFEVLSTERSRRMYDSSRPSDDTIPSEKSITCDEDFYKLFGDAFRRNSRWSTRRPVPELGAADDTRATVDRFYSFWYSFETWRDFAHHDEHDLSQAEHRDERRWMEVQNGRARKKRDQEEVSRIRRLVDLSYKLDPRIRAWKQAEIDEIAEQKRKRIEEKEAKIREEEDRKLNEVLAAELEKERVKEEKAFIKKTRGEIRQTIGEQSDEKFNAALLKLLTDVEIAREYLEQARDAAAAGTCAEYIAMVSEAAPGLMSRTTSTPATPPEPITPPPVSSSDWTADEVQLLTRGMQKYPVGTSRRWEVIQALFGSSKRSVQDIIEMAKVVATQKAPQVNTDRIQSRVSTKAKDQTDAPPDVDYEKVAAAVPEAEEWTPEQQKQLEIALRQVSSTLPPAERWGEIAKLVTGKNKSQCIARFKYIRDVLAKKK